MYNSKLVTTLQSLTADELVRVGQFLQSPYLNPDPNNQDLHNLWNYLSQGLADTSEEYFDRQKVYAAVFQHDEVYKSKLEKLMSQLYAQVRKFLIYEQIESGMSESRELLYLLEAFGERRLSKQFDLVYKKLKAVSKTNPADSAAYLYEYFTLEQKIAEFQLIDNNRRTDLNLPELHFHLDSYYLLQKLELACQLLTRHVFIVPTEYGNRLKYLDLLISELSEEHQEIPIIALYIGAYQLLKSIVDTEETDYFDHFNKLLEKYRDNISHEQQKILQTLNRNYIVYKYQKVSFSSLPQVFNLYRKHLEAGLLYQDKYILPSLFSNIVIFGLRYGEIDWVLRFIQEHRDRLLGLKDSKIVVQYNLAQYYFYTRDYDQALQHLAPTYEDQFYKVAARRYELKILYEQESDLFDSKLDAFKMFIYRLPKSSVHFKNKMANKRFLGLLRQMRRTNTYKNNSRIDKLLEKIRAPEYLADKEWIIEKLEAMR